MKNIKLSKGVSIAIGVVLSILILALGFILIQKVFIRAGNEAPTGVTIEDITGTSATIRYTTTDKATSLLILDKSSASIIANSGSIYPESEAKTSHVFRPGSPDYPPVLLQNTTYYFIIQIGETVYYDGGSVATQDGKIPSSANINPWKFITTGVASTETATVTPTPSISTKVKPTPISHVEIPNNSASQTLTCGETDCAKICQKIKLGQGCEASNFQKAGCGKKVKFSDCSLIP
jgi:hypothetical protein